MAALSAAREGRRVLLFFHQDGCPYCQKLLRDNFGQKAIADKTRAGFEVVAINIWGDREVTVGDKVVKEKDFAAALKVQYTPTLLFFNENTKAVYRADEGNLEHAAAPGKGQNCPQGAQNHGKPAFPRSL